MKQCPKCLNSHNKTGIFCSRSCANSRIFSDDAKLKKSVALSGRSTSRSFQTPEEKLARTEKIRKLRLERYLATSFDDLGCENRRRRVFEEQNYKCNRCGIDNWLGEKLSLELEHKDGNKKNNSRENLEGLCPNCHSLTPTWRGRNKKTSGV